MLKVFPYPITCTVLQFGVGSLLAITMWTLGLHPKPQISGQTVRGPFALLLDQHNLSASRSRSGRCMHVALCAMPSDVRGTPSS